jgi:3-methyladenine DNA glycosylase AlkD
MTAIISQIRRELKQNANQKGRESGQRFFKEEIKIYGLKAAAIRRIGGKYFQIIKTKSKSEIFGLCEELWRSGYLEEAVIACDWSYRIHKDYEPQDFQLFEKWVKRFVSNWAACDTLCNHTIGTFVEMYPEYLVSLKKWTRSPNRWVRRAAAVTLIVPAKEGKYLNEIFEIASLLLLDEDDMVQKGYGWMLKVASQAHLREVFNFVMERKTKMPRTALRYAIEKMPASLKTKAMEK